MGFIESEIFGKGKSLANIFKPEVGCVDYTFISGRIFNWKPATFITK